MEITYVNKKQITTAFATFVWTDYLYGFELELSRRRKNRLSLGRR